MAQNHVNAVALTQALCQLFGEVDGAVLAARTAERDHEVLESAALVLLDAAIDQRENAREKLMHAFLLIQVLDDRRVASGESFELFLATGVGKTAAVENEAAAGSGLVFGPATVKREAENAHGERVGAGSDALQLLGGQHAVERVEQGGHLDGQPDVM